MAAQIRVVKPSDAAEILAIYAPYCESSYVSFEIVAPSIAQMQERVQHISPQYPWLIGEINGQVAGYVYASQHRVRAAYRWSVDVAVYVAVAHQRRGLGGALYRTLFSILRQQGYFKAFAGISLPNPASVALHERVGFRQAAVFRGVGFKSGRWLDVGWWQLELQREQDNPSEPKPFGEIGNGSAVNAALAAGSLVLATGKTAP